jgi:hypothetical protein
MAGRLHAAKLNVIVAFVIGRGFWRLYWRGRH